MSVATMGLRSDLASPGVPPAPPSQVDCPRGPPAAGRGYSVQGRVASSFPGMRSPRVPGDKARPQNCGFAQPPTRTLTAAAVQGPREALQEGSPSLGG